MINIRYILGQTHTNKANLKQNGPSLRDIILSDNNKNRKIHVFFLKPFLLEQTIYNLASFTDLHFLVFCSSPLMYCAIQLNDISNKTHRVKGVRVPSYFDPHFPAFGLNTERYGVFKYLQVV